MEEAADRLAAEELHLAEETLEVAARVAETVGRRHELGDVALGVTEIALVAERAP